MATTKQINEFIIRIAPVLQREAKDRGYKVVSPAIAQALQESLSSKSASGISLLAEKYHNYHGMKCGQYWLSQGRPSVSLKTGEEYKVGVITQITDYFRVFPDMESGLKGYYDFLDMKRYASIRNTSTPEAYMQAIKASDYCTSSTYVKNCLNKIKKYNLTQYDMGLLGSGTVPIGEHPVYKVGGTYTIQVELKVRTGPGTSYPAKTHSQLTLDGKKHDMDKDGAIDAGTKVTCKKVISDGEDIWINTPSGWLAAYYKGKTYII